MAPLGYALMAFGLLMAVASAVPFFYAIIASGDPTINPALQGALMSVGGFVGLLVAAFGGSVLFKARRGKWPFGF